MYTGFWISTDQGNNCFGFNTKKDSRVYVAKRKIGELSDLQIGQHPVFREYDSHTSTVEYLGLEHFIELKRNIGNKNNIIIFDNHNHALFFWYEAYKKRLFKKGTKLIHIDQHTDMNNNPNYLKDIDTLSEKKVFEFTNYKCNVGNFIQPALESGLIGSIELITTEYKLNHFDIEKLIQDLKRKDEEYILDIDLDFWHPDMSIENFEKTLEQTRKLIKHAKYITIATSPYFLEQISAIKICKQILK